MNVIPLAALGRLNTHARAPGADGRFAIYAYKRLATMALAEAGALTVRFILWTGECNRCTKGRYWGWWTTNESETVRCHHCSGTGTKTLRFTETTLPDGQVWHHPWEGMTSPGREIANAIGVEWVSKADAYVGRDALPVEWHPPAEWHPNLPAQALPVGELVPLMNEVEDWVETAPIRTRGGACWWVSEAAKRHLHQQKHERIYGEPSHGYRIDIGDQDAGCHVCGTTENLEGYRRGRMTPLLEWTVRVCKAHSKEPYPSGPPPAELITPDIRRWLDRHERVEVVR